MAHKRSTNKTAAAGAVILTMTFALANPGNAADARLRLNHEAMKLRLTAERQIEVMTTLHDTLRLCNMLLPIRIKAVSRRGGNAVANAEKIYKEMLAMSSSAEIFTWLLDFLSEDEALREMLQKTFVRTKDDREKQDSFLLDGTEFYIRWFWLYPTQNGLLLSAQDEMTRETADEIWDTQMLFPIYELHFPISPSVRESPFWQKGVTKILKAFPSAHISDGPHPELVYAVFPGSSGIPNIVRRSVELLD
jgi:hypothetical protein